MIVVMANCSSLPYLGVLAVWLIAPASAQRLHVEPLDYTLTDIVMIGPGDRHFDSEVSKLLPAAQLPLVKPLLPYSVLVRSRTPSPLRRIDIVFRVAEPGGGTKRVVERFSVHFSIKAAMGAAPQLLALYEQPSSKDLRVQRISPNGLQTSPSRGMIREPLPVSVSVDLVIYWDGRVAGPDNAGSFPQVIPDMEAGLDLCRRVLEIQHSGGDLAAFLEPQSRQVAAAEDYRLRDSVPSVAAMLLGIAKQKASAKIDNFCSTAVSTIPTVMSSLHR